MGPESPVSSKLEGIPSRGPIPSGSPPRLLGGRCLSMIWSLLETWTPGPHPDPRGKGESPGELYAHQGLRSPGAQCIFGVRRAGRAVSAGAAGSMAELELFSWDSNEEEAGKCLDPGRAAPRNGAGHCSLSARGEARRSGGLPSVVVVDVGYAFCLVKEDTLP